MRSYSSKLFASRCTERSWKSTGKLDAIALTGQMSLDSSAVCAYLQDTSDWSGEWIKLGKMKKAVLTWPCSPGC